MEDVTRKYTTDWAGALGRHRVSEEDMGGFLACANKVLQGGGKGGEEGKQGGKRKEIGGGGDDRKRNAGEKAGQIRKGRSSSCTSTSAGTDTGGKGKGGRGAGGGKGKDCQTPAETGTIRGQERPRVKHSSEARAPPSQPLPRARKVLARPR